MLVFVAAISMLAIPVLAIKPGTDFSGSHFNLNIIGKKEDWGGQGGSYDNPDRHTIFVPLDTSDYDVDTKKGTLVGSGIKILMTQSDSSDPDDDFAVIDGNAFDGEAAFQLKSGRYRVYIVAKAKNPKSVGEAYTDITGWVWYENTTEYFFDIGTVSVKKSNGWQDATDLFYVSSSESEGQLVEVSGGGLGMWVFEYLTALEEAEATDTEYFWQYDNNGNKLVQVRFYEV